MRSVRRALVLTVVVTWIVSAAYAAPIQRVQGIIHEVGEGFILLNPDDGSKPLKLLLRWKAHFVPPKLPLPGDQVLVLYKARDEGLVVYEVNYLKIAPEQLPSPSTGGADGNPSR
jgi:hypothetical protein